MEELLNKIEAYGFACDGGSLAMCQDWMTLRALLKPDSRGQAREGRRVVTEEMVTAYLKANDAYWQDRDKIAPPIGRWRAGTAREATRVSLEAALAASPTPDEQRAQAAQEGVEATVERLMRDEVALVVDVERRHCIGRAAAFDVRGAKNALREALRTALAGRSA